MPRGFGTCRVGEARWRDDVVEQALALLTALGYHGIAQTEFRLDPRDERFKLMEVNPRLWQWHGLARACGVDLPRIAYLDVLGRPQRPVRSGPQHDGRRWVVAAAHLRASRQEGTSLRRALREIGPGAVEGTFDLRDPLPAIVQASGLVTAPIARRLHRRGRGASSDHAAAVARSPAAGDARRHNMAQAALVAGRRGRDAGGHPRRRLRRRFSSSIAACGATGGCIAWRSACWLAMAALIVVYLAGYFALENSQQLSQYSKGMTKFVLHFAFLVAGTQHVIDRGERLLRRTVGAFVVGLAINCAYGVAQLVAQVGGGINLDKAVIGPLTFGQGSLGGINVYGQATAVQSGSYVSLGVYRVNALALDPNHLGIMLCVPILLLIPFSLRAGLRSRRGLVLAGLLGFFLLVDVLTLSRSGFLGLACGLAILAWPLRRQLLVPRLVVPVAAALGAIGLVLASSPYVRQVVRSRVTVSDNSAKVHFQFFDLVQPVLDAHPVFGLGLNTFSVYYEFLTGKTNWGPHSFYIALLDETGLVGRRRVRGVPCLGRAAAGGDPARLARAAAPRRRAGRRLARPRHRAHRRAGGHADRQRLLPDDAVLLLLRRRPDRRRGLGPVGRTSPAPARMTDVSVVIVSYESRDLLAQCLAALAADGQRRATVETIVVDQASQDGTAAWLANEHPEVHLVALAENVGFGAGNNRGAAVASGRWLLLLNSDAFVRPGALDELVRFAEAGRAERRRPAPALARRAPAALLQALSHRLPDRNGVPLPAQARPALADPQRLLLRRVRARRGASRRLGHRRVRVAAARPVRAARRLRRGVLPLLRGGRPALLARAAWARRPGTTRPPRSSTCGAARRDGARR